MAEAKRIVAVCSCEDTMPLDEQSLVRGCKDGDIRRARHLCRSEFRVFQAMLAEGRPLTVGCTQEAPLFDEAASEAGFGEDLAFANIRSPRDGPARRSAQGPKWPRSSRRRQSRCRPRPLCR